MARYQRVLWHHKRPGEPVELYSEVTSGFETRKVEIYRNGRHDYADRRRSTGSTRLGEKMMPSVAEINEDPEFSATAISGREFEDVWRRATGGTS